MWLRDFLPQDVPNSRILLYGYPSTVTGGRSTEKIEDIAKTFLNRLTLHRKGTAVGITCALLYGFDKYRIADRTDSDQGTAHNLYWSESRRIDHPRGKFQS